MPDSPAVLPAKSAPSMSSEPFSEKQSCWPSDSMKKRGRLKIEFLLRLTDSGDNRCGGNFVDF
jgi:hypothetical protein